jgi:hypothetical protein
VVFSVVRILSKIKDEPAGNSIKAHMNYSVENILKCSGLAVGPLLVPLIVTSRAMRATAASKKSKHLQNKLTSSELQEIRHKPL